MIDPFFEPEPEHSGSLETIIHDAIGSITDAYELSITFYEVKKIDVPSGQCFTIDLYFQKDEPIALFLDVPDGSHQPMFGLIIEKITATIERRKQLKGMFREYPN